jgi:CDP-6-deoxy-D-xylo-4-hexulose-3-dehydrase
MIRVTYPLAENTWGEQETEAVTRVLKSGNLTMGARTAELEEAFARKFNRRHALMVSSGSAANLLSIAALSHRKGRPLRPGDEVIVPAISWATTYYPLLQYGLRLRFVDIDLRTLNLDPAQLERALTERTRMVVAVSILGNPCDLGEIRAFCDRHDLVLFEDNCESMGAEIGGKLCGSFGELSTFSTFFSHHMSTIEGGFVTTDDRELYELALCMRAHGWIRDLPDENSIHPKKGGDSFSEAYCFVLPGYNLRPMELTAAAGLVQLEKLDAMIEARRQNARRFLELFAGDERFILQSETGKSSWFCFTLILSPTVSMSRARVFERLNEAGIQFRMITGGNFVRHPVIRHFDYDTVGVLPNANLAHDRGFFVGNSPRALDEELLLLRRVLDGVR